MSTQVHADTLWVVIAAYNEGQAIREVITGLHTAGYLNVAVVDDGSRDATADVAYAAGAYVIAHPMNLGQGAALQTGIDFALAHGATHIVTFDADGQHDPRDIAPMLAALEANQAEVALGSRFLGRTVNLPWQRRLALRLAVGLTRLVTRLPLTDAHNGLRVLTRTAARQLRIRQNRMAHASEILHHIVRHGIPWVECPVTIRYTAYSLAKGQKLSNALSILKDLLMGRLSR